MKKLLFYSLFALTLLAAPSCGDDDEDEPTNTPSNNGTKPSNDTKPDNEPATKSVTFTVTFDTDGGGDVSPQTVEGGKTANKPEDPTKENCTFRGWYLGDKEYNFTSAVTADITLKARYKYANAFSISETKQVYFSSGNLQYHCKNKEWRFAPNQYDFIGQDNANIADDYDGYIDFFGWGTSDNPTLASLNFNDYAEFSDWGTKIDDGNLWQTLTGDEWTYLIEGRSNALEKYGVAEVAGVQGLILLPDGWSLPAGLSFNGGVASDDGQEYYKEKNNYSAEDWRKMESAGAVFLPAVGDRDGTSVDYVGISGYYWASSAYDYVNDNARLLCFYSNRIYTKGNGYLWYGRSVRLVRPL